MTPPRIAFSRDELLEAAFQLVREEGMGKFSARNVAERMKCSVAPVYRVYSSMLEFKHDVLVRIHILLQEYTHKPFTDLTFLNIGVGMVVFARDETHLFQALFLDKHNFTDILTDFRASVLSRMEATPSLNSLSRSTLENLLNRLWLFTLGLASTVIYTPNEDISNERIIRELKQAGFIFSYVEYFTLERMMENAVAYLDGKI